MEAEPNECKNCFSVIEDGQEYRECTNPENLNKNPHKLCKTCYEKLLKGYDYEDELLDPRTLAPTPKQNADGTEMLDARGRPILMSPEELIEFYRTDYKMENTKHVKHEEGCPWKDGKLVKKTMGQPEQPITLRVTDGAAAAAVSGFARGGIHDDDDDDFNKALLLSVQPSRPSGPGAGVRRQGQGAAAAAHEPEDVAFRNALLESTRGTETPIQQIHRELNRRGIQVSEEDVRRIFQDNSRQYDNFDVARRATEKYFVDAAARNPPPPSVQTPSPSYDELLQNRELYPQLRARRLLPGQQPGQQQLFQPPPLPPLPPGWRSLRNLSDNVQFYAGPNGEVTRDFPWNAYDEAARRRGGKKSKMSKSKRGKKSKMSKSRRGKKSKIIKSRKGKKSKMTRKKV